MKYLLLACAFILAACSVRKPSEEKWQQLFNGKNLNGWTVKIKGHPLAENYKNTFRVKDGLLQVNYSEYEKFNELYGHIFYDREFSDYLIETTYRFVGEQLPDGPKWAYRNNGIMIHCQAPKTMALDQDYPISIEAQLLGGNGKEERPTLNACTPGTYIDVDGKLVTTHCINSVSKTYAGDQWVKAQVLVLGDSLIRHYVNGQMVLEYSKPQIGGGNVINYLPGAKVDGKPLKSGYIALQSESHSTEFKEVRLFDLKKYRGNSKKLDEVVSKLLAGSMAEAN
jgi:hypothetical protein